MRSAAASSPSMHSSHTTSFLLRGLWKISNVGIVPLNFRGPGHRETRPCTSNAIWLPRSPGNFAVIMRLVIVADSTGQSAGSFCYEGVEISLTANDGGITCRGNSWGVIGHPRGRFSSLLFLEASYWPAAGCITEAML